MTARSDHSDLTTWTDEFCDRRDLGTIYSLITEEELCARRYWKRQVPKRRWGCRNQLGRIPSSETLFRTPLEPTIAVFTALSSSCHCLAPAPVPACRRRAACLPPSRNHEALPPAGPATHCFPYPVRQRRSFQFDSLARVHLALAIEREMIGILRHQNVRQQSGTGQPTRNRSARSRSLHDLLAMPAAQSRLIRPAPV